MNENLNLVEILKDCPKGTKLYSTVYGEVKFEEIGDGFLRIVDSDRNVITYLEILAVLEWFYKNHFDINDLISKNLAIDATGLNIY